MVVRTRLRAFLFPLILYFVSGGIGGYFVWHAINGDRGLKVSDEYEKSIAMLQAQLTATKADRAQWQHRIALMHGDAIDRDLLEEESRATLDRVNKSDLVIFLPQR
jgi:cell division protein FtsB